MKSLGVLLAVALAGLQFLAVLVVVFSSYVSSERALLQHARDLLRDVGINTIEHSKGFLSPAEGAAELAARLAQNRVIASDDQSQLEQLLFQQLQIAPQFAGVYYGSRNGGFVYVMRSPDGPAPFRSKIITMRGAQRTTDLIWRNDDFVKVEEMKDPTDTFDPRTRPWYQQARAERTTIWTDPYIFFSSHQPGITLAAPVLDSAGRLRGVVGVDIEISAISGFLARLNIGENGKALIIHKNGDVIAHPDLELVKTTDDDGTLRFANIREFGDPIARAAFGALAADEDVPVANEVARQFTYGGQSYVASIMPIISDKLPWTIAVYAPENDFTGVIKRNRTQNIWIAAMVAAVSGLIGLALANYIAKPVRAFAVRSSLIAQGEIDPDDPAPKTYRELERANAALVQQIVARREAEREYGQTFDLSSRAMAQVAPGSGAFIRVNGRFCQITGRSALELAGMRFSDLVLAEDRGIWPATPLPGEDDAGQDVDADPAIGGEVLMAESLSGARADADPQETALNHEMRIRRMDGCAVWVTISAIMIRDHRGEPLHAVVTMDDITEARHREDQILRLNRDLSHLARGNTMGQMAAGLAHELNQPLTAIAQNADTALLVLDENPRADAELQQILQEIERQSLRAGDIIRALRGFIRKDEGERGSFDLTELSGQALRLVQAEATEASVTIQSELPADLPEVDGNRVQVAQVIVNLIRNGIEAIAHGKADDGDRLVTLSARVAGPAIEVTVADTGPGVSPEIQLFAQFETTKVDGMGLGLSICRSIVEANGGRLWEDGVPGEGARFHFTLPLRRPA